MHKVQCAIEIRFKLQGAKYQVQQKIRCNRKSDAVENWVQGARYKTPGAIENQVQDARCKTPGAVENQVQ